MIDEKEWARAVEVLSEARDRIALDLPVDDPWRHRCEALGHLQVLARAAVGGPAGEIGRLDDQRVAFNPAA